MTERTFRLIMGAMLLLALYFDAVYVMIALIAVMTVEGITNWRVPSIITRIRFGTKELPNHLADSEAACRARFSFDAERALRLVVVLLLTVSYVLFYNLLWFIPWLVGFALAVAGLSGICPMLIGLKRFGFR